jgi:hypothetical protein
VYGGKPSDIKALANLPFPTEARTKWDKAVGTRPDEDIIRVESKEIGAFFLSTLNHMKLRPGGLVPSIYLFKCVYLNKNNLR